MPCQCNSSDASDSPSAVSWSRSVVPRGFPPARPLPFCELCPLVNSAMSYPLSGGADTRVLAERQLSEKTWGGVFSDRSQNRILAAIVGNVIAKALKYFRSYARSAVVNASTEGRSGHPLGFVDTTASIGRNINSLDHKTGRRITPPLARRFKRKLLRPEPASRLGLGRVRGRDRAGCQADLDPVVNSASHVNLKIQRSLMAGPEQQPIRPISSSIRS